MELDIYIPEIKTGIEYDGAIWHRNTLSSERDKKKYDICVGAGIRLIRIKERIPSKQINAEIANADHVICIENPNNYKQLDAVIQQMSRFFTMPSIINTAKDSSAILASSRAIVRNDSLAVIYPQIALEWNHARNGHLVPAMCTKASADLVWWKCKKGHEYQMRIYSRVAGSGCPYCAGKKILIGENDLATTNPELINEWDNNRNNPLTPQSVTSGTAREVWWICKKGHCWKARIQNRVRGIGCPYCSGRYAIKGINDLATINPDIAQKWHPTKNGSLKPDEVLPNSEKRVWWLCENGHEWENTVANMKNGNCPKCMKEKSSRKRTEKRVELPYDGFTQKK